MQPSLFLSLIVASACISFLISAQNTVSLAYIQKAQYYDLNAIDVARSTGIFRIVLAGGSGGTDYGETSQKDGDFAYSSNGGYGAVVNAEIDIKALPQIAGNAFRLTFLIAGAGTDVSEGHGRAIAYGGFGGGGEGGQYSEERYCAGGGGASFVFVSDYGVQATASDIVMIAGG